MATNSLLVNGEIAALLASMRSSNRWGSSSRYSEDEMEDPLVEALKALRRRVFAWQDWLDVDPLEYLAPFLQVIKSSETSGTVTDMALSAVLKFLNHDVLGGPASVVCEAVQGIAEAVTQCKFEATYPAFDECVLGRILEVLVALVRSPLGRLLSQDNVINIFQACYRIGHYQTEKGRATTELLTQASRRAMTELVGVIFSRLEAPPADDDGRASPMLSHATARLQVESFLATTPPILDEADADSAGAEAVAAADGSSSTAGPADAQREPAFPADTNPAELPPSAVDAAAALPAAEPAEAVPGLPPAPHEIVSVLLPFEPPSEADGGYGVDAVREILYFIISLIGSASSGSHSDLPAHGLELMGGVLHAGGTGLGAHDALMALLQEDLVKAMFTAARSATLPCLAGICQVALGLYAHLGHFCLLQVEALLGLLLLPIAEGRGGGVSVAHQQVALEGVLDFCRQPAFVRDVYLNCDCRIERSNLFEQLCALLSKAAFPVNGPLGAVHLLSLDGIVAILSTLSAGCGSGMGAAGDGASAATSVGEPEHYVDIWSALSRGEAPPVLEAVGAVASSSCSAANVARVEKQLKGRLVAAAEHFNRSAKKGFQYVQSLRLLPPTLDPTSVALFLRCCPGLAKLGVGELLGDGDPFYQGVRDAFSQTFDFRGMDFVMALRLFMDAFRPPGESQKIDRIMQVFGQRYFQQVPSSGLASPDAAYILAYSVMMLNTDLHNSQNKRAKMTLDEFANVNRTTNEGKPVARDLLALVYNAIKAEELKISAECSPEELPAQVVYWAQMAAAARRPRGRMAPGTRYTSPALERDMFALVWGPTLASVSVILDNSGDPGVVGRAMEGLLAAARLAAYHGLDEVADQIVGDLSKFTAGLNPALGSRGVVAYGESDKARAAVEATFAIANRYGDCLRGGGWRCVLDAVVRLHRLGLLTPAVIAADGEDVEEARQRMPRPPLSKSARASSASLFSRAINSLISIEGPDAAAVENASAREQALTFAAGASAEACRVDEIVGDSKFLTAESLVELAKAAMWAGGNVVAAARTGEGTDAAELCLELLITLALRNRDRVALVWPLVHEYLAACTAADTAEESNALVERAVAGLLRVCQRLLPYKEDTQLLASLRLVVGLSPGVAWELAERIAGELLALVSSSAPYIRSGGDWRTVCALVRLTAVRPEAAPKAIEALGLVCRDGAALSGESYLPLLETCLALMEGCRGARRESAVPFLDMVDALFGWLVAAGQEGGEAAGQEGGEAALSYAVLVDLWLTTVGVLAKGLCRDGCRPLRDGALAVLHRSLLASAPLNLAAEVWVQTTRELLVPLVSDLAKLAAGGKAAAKSHPGLDKSVRLAVNMLTKVLLQYVPLMEADKDFYAVWGAALGALQECMRVRHEAVLESVPESAKNLVLVLATSGVLTPAWVDAQGRSLWDLTWSKAHTISSGLNPQMLATAGVLAAPPQPAQPTPGESAAVAAGQAVVAQAEAAASAQPPAPPTQPVAAAAAVDTEPQSVVASFPTSPSATSEATAATPDALPLPVGPSANGDTTLAAEPQVAAPVAAVAAAARNGAKHPEAAGALQSGAAEEEESGNGCKQS